MKIKRKAEQEENVKRKKAADAEKPRRGMRNRAIDGDDEEAQLREPVQQPQVGPAVHADAVEERQRHAAEQKR